MLSIIFAIMVVLLFIQFFGGDLDLNNEILFLVSLGILGGFFNLLIYNYRIKSGALKEIILIKSSKKLVAFWSVIFLILIALGVFVVFWDKSDENLFILLVNLLIVCNWLFFKENSSKFFYYNDKGIWGHKYFYKFITYSAINNFSASDEKILLDTTRGNIEFNIEEEVTDEIMELLERKVFL